MKEKILLISSSIHGEGNTHIALQEAEKALTDCEVKWSLLCKESMGDTLEKVDWADGIIWGTPVYFGAWNSFSQELYDRIDNLFPKVVGFVAVGAKRNGGQETTVTFASWDVIDKGACVVNDGDPVSQFGGTCVAGIRRTINDKEGLEMCFNLGKRVSEVARIIKAGTFDREVNVIHWSPIGNFRFKRCRGCDTCPDKVDADYKCRFFDDDMHKVHDNIVSADLIIPVRYNLRFFERTRYLRRDDYRLSYHVAFIPEQRWIPLFMKQNCILARKRAEDYAKLIASGKEVASLNKAVYKPIGHEPVKEYVSDYQI